MNWAWWAGLLVLFGLAVFGVLWKTLSDMASTEMRARLDDVPAMLVELALLRVPAHLREPYREDWVGNLLVAYNEKNARYPITKLVCAAKLTLPLFVFARVLRKEFKAVQDQGLADERNEVLADSPDAEDPKRNSIAWKVVSTHWSASADFSVLRGDDDRVLAVEVKTGTRPISVAELLAKDGTIGAAPPGGRRRRRGSAGEPVRPPAPDVVND